MELSKWFNRTRFTPEVIRSAVEKLQVPEGCSLRYGSRSVQTRDGDWSFDDTEEWMSTYRGGSHGANLSVAVIDVRHNSMVSLRVHQMRETTVVTVEAAERPLILDIMGVFDAAHDDCRLPEPKPEPAEEVDDEPVIFIGHGHSGAWRHLKDHLSDQHGYAVKAYEVGARAGHTVRDILDELRSEATFAILVMTGEDEQPDGSMRPRENVVHEVGLFQGTLGYGRVIALIEEGVEPFSNLQGIHYLSFPKAPDGIRSAFGDVLATLRREFG